MKKNKYPQNVSYPSRINALILDNANAQRKLDGLTWPTLTAKLLKLYTKKGMALFYVSTLFIMASTARGETAPDFISDTDWAKTESRADLERDYVAAVELTERLQKELNTCKTEKDKPSSKF